LFLENGKALFARKNQWMQLVHQPFGQPVRPMDFKHPGGRLNGFWYRSWGARTMALSFNKEVRGVCISNFFAVK
jgi:hypothetical protein